MITRLILAASVIWLPAVMYVMLANETKFKKNIAVGVTLPLEAREDAVVLEELTSFRKNCRNICILLTLLIFLSLPVSDFYVYFTIWLIWIDAVCILPYIPYVRTNAHLRKYKAEKGWGSTSQHMVTVNLSAIRKFHYVRLWVFVPAVILSLLPAAADPSLFAMYLLIAVCSALCWAGYRFLYRERQEMVDGNTELTVVLGQIRRYNWGKIWVISAYAMALYSLTIFLTVHLPAAGVICGTVVTAIFCWIILRIELKVRSQQEKLTRDSGGEWFVDDDSKWIWGLFYYNPDDTRLMINARVGMNSTFNLARPAGKLIMGFCVILLAVLPFTGVLLRQAGEQEIVLTADPQVITAEAGMTDYSVDRSSITEMLVLDELPAGFHRKVGTGMENLCKGKFGSDDYPDLTVMLDPTAAPYLLIQTADGKYYLFGTHSSEATEDILNQLGLE